MLFKIFAKIYLHSLAKIKKKQRDIKIKKAKLNAQQYHLAKTSGVDNQFSKGIIVLKTRSAADSRIVAPHTTRGDIVSGYTAILYSVLYIVFCCCRTYVVLCLEYDWWNLRIEDGGNVGF